MTRFLLIGLLFLLMACPGNKATEKREKNANPKKSGITEFAINKEIHNFGELIAGEVVVYSFTIKNKGTKNLVISEVDEGCGCIEVKTLKNPILPGDEGKLEVLFDSSGLFGNQFKTISLKVNTREKTKELAITANVTNKSIKYKL